MHNRLIARQKAVNEDRHRRLEELRAVILLQVSHLRQDIKPLQEAGLRIDIHTFIRALDGMDRIISTFDPDRDDITITLVPIASALDTMVHALARLRMATALIRLH